MNQVEQQIAEMELKLAELRSQQKTALVQEKALLMKRLAALDAELGTARRGLGKTSSNPPAEGTDRRRVYDAVMAGHATSREIAASAAVNAEQVSAVLNSLRQRGLIRSVGQSWPRRYVGVER